MKPSDDRRPRVRVLEADPDLAAALEGDRARVATERACAPLVAIEDEAGLARVAASLDPDTAVGLLVLDGILTRTLDIGSRTSTELLGAGDLLRPWERDDEDRMLPCRIGWRVLERARVAVLDERFATAIAPWPQIWGALLSRTLRRSRALAVSMTLSHMTRVDQRILLLFCHFAERWGRVRADGIVVRLPLTHETLGALVGARRPSVTSALSQLAKADLLRPGERGEWVLTSRAQARIDTAATVLDTRIGLGPDAAALVA